MHQTKLWIWLLTLTMLLAVVGVAHAQDSLETITLSIKGMV